jgi:hypothetical protein
VPDPFGIVYAEDGASVTIPTEYWIQLAQYMIDVEATRQKYEAIRSEYE